MDKVPSVIVFASGKGTLFEAIVEGSSIVSPAYSCQKLVVSKLTCSAVEVAERLNVKVQLDKEFFAGPDQADLYVLAGYLRKIPEEFTAKFGTKTINSHPALLPKFGGKGMYGRRVHEAVINASEKESGFTVHFVNEEYDSGAVLFQGRVSLAEGETAESLEEKVKSKERELYPKIISEVLSKQS